MELKDKIISELSKKPQTFKQLKKILALKSFNDSKNLDRILRKL